VPAEAWEDEDATDRFDLGLITAEQLAKARAHRPPAVRLADIEHRQGELERAHKETAKIASDTQLAVSEVKGQLNGQDRVLENIQQSVQQLAAREHVTFTASVDVAKHKEIVATDTSAEAKKERGKRFTAAIGVALTAIGAGLGVLGHYIAGKL